MSTLTFDYNGGHGSVASKKVIEGDPIGELPTATRFGATFLGWYVNGVQVTSQSSWPIDADGVAVAEWDTRFGRVVDYFNLASSNLRPIASDNGDNKKRVCVTNASWSGTTQLSAGRYSSGVDDTSNVWRNPSVTYRVVGDMTFACQLGTAFAKSGTISGYMITAVETTTLVGELPVIKVEAVANEGVNAINLFSVSFSVEAAEHAQNLMSALAGSGYVLQRCTLRATADPVVLAENNFPCASDVVRGKITVVADVIAEAQNYTPGYGNNFALVGSPKRGTDAMFETYSITLQREII